MKLKNIILIGIIIGILNGGGIFFEPAEPYKVEIFFAAILNVILVCIITGLSIKEHHRLKHGILFGLLYGFLFAVVVYLAKGGFASGDAPYVVPADMFFGSVSGYFVYKFGINTKS